MERAAGIEPACLTWKDSALPLSYARDRAPIEPALPYSSKSFLSASGIISRSLRLFPFHLFTMS